MKRCKLCGNIGEDTRTVCIACGHPFDGTEENFTGYPMEAENAECQAPEPAAEGADSFSEMPEEDAPGQQVTEMAAGEPEVIPAETEEPEDIPAESEEPEEELPETEDFRKPEVIPAQGGQENSDVENPAGEQHPHRMRSGPMIYGQSVPMAEDPRYMQQGYMRREVQGGAMNAAPGRNVQSQPSQNRPPALQPWAQQTQPVQPRQPHSQLNTQIMQTARRMLRSPLFLLIVLFQTAYLAGSIAAVFMNQLNYSQAARLLNSVSLPGQIAGYTGVLTSALQQLDSSAAFMVIILHIPDMLLCIGLWLIFIMALAARERMSGIGFSFVKVNVIIHMVVSFIGLLAMLVLSVALVVAAWSSKETATIVVSVIVLVFMILLSMLVIMYYFSYLATLKTCRINGDTGDRYGRVSVYVAVISIVIALFSIINLLSGIVNNEIAAIVQAAGKMGWLILFAVWIMLYRSKMDRFEED